MAIIERIVTVYNDKGSKQAVKDLNKLEKNFADAGKKIAKAFAVATAAAGALAIKIGKDAVQAAMEDQKSQILLANALRNTVNANDEAIAASEAYITSLQNQLGVADDELRPALAVLATASGDLAQAQTLLGLSLDVAAGSGKSLSTITSALSKAQNGNFTSLQRLFPALDRNAIASGDLVALTQQLADLYGGAAQDNANTFAGQMQILKLRFGEILETIGYRFLPILENLVKIINEQVVPAIDAWLEANGERLATVFENAVGYVVAFAQSLFDAFNFVARNINVFKQLGAVIIATFAGAKVAAAVSAIIGAIKAIITVTKALRTATLGAAAAQALLTGGISAAAGATAFAAALYGINKAMDKFGDTADKTSDKLDFDFKGLKLGANDYTKGLEKLTVTQKKNTAASKKAAASAALELATKKALAALAKLGVKPTTEKDPIQLEAARLNLLKQANLEESRKVAALIANAEAQMKVNQNAQRYADLLQVLSDQTISSEEVSVLAAKWGITTGQVLEYIARVYAASTTDINDGPIVNLLMKWGLTKQEAEKYVDFTRALKDEKLDDKEIEELMGKWRMTRAEVVAYALSVQAGTVFSSTWADPGKLAEQSWIDALTALNAYLKALGQKPSTTPNPPPSTKAPVIPPIVPPIVPPIIPPIIPPKTAGGTVMTPGGRIISATPEVFDVAGSKILAGFGTPMTSKVDDTLREATARQRISDIFATIGDFGAGGYNPNVVINVSGSVISEGDLIENVRTGILNFQQSGKPITAIQRL